MDFVLLYPLRFEPIYQYRLWGGRRLGNLLSAPLSGEGPIGEAWLLSDRKDHPSLVAEGPLKGSTIEQLIERSPEEMLGTLAGHFSRFPVLLKFLDVQKTLSVQVHPPDAFAELIPTGETGKTESWVVLQTGPKAQIYAGLDTGTTAEVLRKALETRTLENHLSSFSPRVGDAVFIRAGTVHSLSDVVVFEAQENSDVTFRLYDWNHIDPQTKQKRPLQVDQALACINYTQGAIAPVTPKIDKLWRGPWEKLIHCDHFSIHRICTEFPFVGGAEGACRVLVCLEGKGELKYGGGRYPLSTGDVILLPAVVGACPCQPNGDITLLEISLPEIS